MPTHFETLGVPRRFQLDAAEIEQRYKTLSRQWHPDRWARASLREKRVSLEKTTALNDAYRVLRDPVKRALYLLALEGLEPAGEESRKLLPMDFLEEVMEDREKLMEARLAGDRAAVEKQAQGIRARRNTVLARVTAGFGRWEAENDRALLAALARELATLRYFDRFLEEVEGDHHRR